MAKANSNTFQELGLVADQQTRWNSTFLMIRRALLLRPRISLFIAEASDLDSADLLSKDDWSTLQIVHDLLQPFWKLTLRLEGNAINGSHGAIWEVLPAMEVLINGLEAASEVHTYRKAKHLHICIMNALKKLRDYYQRLDESPVYAASVVLNPAIKERHFDRNQGRGLEDWTPKSKEDIRNFWATEYKGKVITELDPTPTTTKANEAGDVDEFENYLYGWGHAMDDLDEYDSYCGEKPLPKAPPHFLRYWNGQAINTPSLSQMALDLLSIPAMSAECERVFSSSKILISDHRNRLREDVIEANECLRYWHQKGYFEYQHGY
jgi:hypothetical protein